MFVPLRIETHIDQNKFIANSDVYLEASHIIIKKNIADKIFGKEAVVLSIFYPKENSFMIAPASEEFFRKMHKANQQMLKIKNAHGDRSLSVMDILLDNDIDDSDRDLVFTIEEALHLIKINF